MNGTTEKPVTGSGGAAALLDAHKKAETGSGSRGPRGPYRKTKERMEQAGIPQPPSSGAPYLPPTTTLPQVMASGTGLFYALHAAFLDDEDWIVGDTVKKEMGDILAWMLADDFYKVGGIGKYIVGSIMFLGVYSMQAVKTAKKRRERIAALKRAAPQPGSSKSPQTPGPQPPVEVPKVFYDDKGQPLSAPPPGFEVNNPPKQA